MSRNKKRKIKGQKLSSKQLQYEVLKLFKRHPKKRLNPKQVIKKLKVANNKDAVQYALDQLVERNEIAQLENYKYKIKKSAPRKGTISCLPEASI
jgi:ribonuclease R